MKILKRWSKEEEKILLENFDKVKNLSELTKLLPGREYHSVRSKVNWYGLKKQKIYYKNESFFEIPNVINSYWSGCIMTDGNIGKSGVKTKNSQSTVFLGFNTRDKYHLERFVKDAESNYLIKDIVRKGQIIKCNPTHKPFTSYFSTLRFCHANKWAEDLFKNWKIPAGNKTFITTGPNENLSVENCLAFIKGQIDGDGTLSLVTENRWKPKSKSIRFTMLGTNELLKWNKQFLDTYIFKENRKGTQYKKENIYHYHINSKYAIRLFNLLNALQTPYLKRKWENPDIIQTVNEWNQRYPELLTPLTPEELSQPNNIIIPPETQTPNTVNLIEAETALIT